MDLLGDLEVLGSAIFDNEIIYKGERLEVSGVILDEDGITAPNIIYSLRAGDGIAITGVQNPIITNTGVLSVQGKTGAVNFTAGDGITIDGLKISADIETPALQNVFKNIKIGSDTLTAGSATDTFTLAEGSGVSFLTDVTNKKLTISGSNTSGFTRTGTNVLLSEISDYVGIGTATPAHKLDVSGVARVTGILYADAGLSTTTGDLLLDSGSGTIKVAKTLDIEAGATIAPTVADTNTLVLNASSGVASKIIDVRSFDDVTSYLSVSSTGILTVNGSSLTNAGILESGGAINLTNANNAIVGTAIVGGWTLNSNTFDYRRGITITNTDGVKTLPTNYEVEITITGTNAAQIFANARGDQQDFRLAYNTTEIPRNITSFTSSSIIFKIQLQASILVSGSSSLYYMYYGNSSLASGATTYVGNIILDTLDSIGSNWISSDADQFPATQETTEVNEGSGSLKTQGTVNNITTFSTTAQNALPGNLTDFGFVSATLGSTTYLYMVGGGTSEVSTSATSNVYVASVNAATGNISASTLSGNSLPVALTHNSVAMISGGTGPSTIYSFGGRDVNGTPTANIYQASVSIVDGTVGSFSDSGNDLPQTVFAQAVTSFELGSGKYIYAIGGTNGSSNQTSVYKYTVTGSTLSAGTDVGQAQLPNGLAYHAAVSGTISGSNYMWLIGGRSGSSGLTAIYKATVDSNGNVTSITSAGQIPLPSGLYAHTAFFKTINSTNYIYIIGNTAVYKAIVNSSGNVISVTATGQTALPLGLTGHASFGFTDNSSNNYAYLIGGFTNTAQNAVKRATINSNQTSYTASRANFTATDLSNKNDLTFSVKSSLVGTYMTVDINIGPFNAPNWQTCSFGGSGSFTVLTTLWEAQTCDISGIASRNAVTGVRVRVVSSQTTDFIAYFDDMEVLTNASTVTHTTLALTGVLGAADLAINAQGTGEIKINYDATNALAGTGGLTVYNGGSTGLFRVNSFGNVGIGTTAPTEALDVIGNIKSSTLNSNGAVYSNNGVLTNVNPSSMSYKYDVEPWDVDPEKLLTLTVKSFKWLNNDEQDFGLIAEEVRDTLPEIYRNDGKTKGYRLSHLPFYLLEIAKKQQAKLDQVLAEIASLKGTQAVASESAALATSSAVLGAADGLLDDDTATLSSLLVSGNSTLNNVGVTGKITAGLLSIVGYDDDGQSSISTLAGPLKLQSLGLGNVDIMNGKVVLDTRGNIVTVGKVTATEIAAEKVTTDSLYLKANKSVGVGIIPAGETGVIIEAPHLSRSSHVFTQLETVIKMTLIVTEKRTGDSFKVEITEPATKDIKFSWWLVN